MDIYAPLAGRMGMQWMREELEDLAFRVLNPEGRAFDHPPLHHAAARNRRRGPKITADMRIELDKAGIEAEVFGRAKKPYSIWRKMQEKEQAFSRLSDIYGFRVITADEADCYRVLGAIHQRWRAVPGRFKDYISQPKSNGYRSIHTTVSGRDGKRVEVQIRTRADARGRRGRRRRPLVLPRRRAGREPLRGRSRQVDRDADRTVRRRGRSRRVPRTRQARDVYRPGVLLHAQGRRGQAAARRHAASTLPMRSTRGSAIACVGAKVDGIRVPLWTRLKNGQSVEIITAEGQTPQATWIDIVATGRAKAAIRRAPARGGPRALHQAGPRTGARGLRTFGKKATDKALRTAAKHAGPATDATSCWRGSAAAELTAREVVAALYPELAPADGDEIDARRAVVGLPPNQTLPARALLPAGAGRTDRRHHLSRARASWSTPSTAPRWPNSRTSPSRWVDLHWHSGRHPPVHTVSLDITIANDAGVLGRICTLIGEQKANISDLRFVDRKPDFYRLIVEVDLRDVEHLHMVMTALEAESDVAQVERHRDLQPQALRRGAQEGTTGGLQAASTKKLYAARRGRGLLAHAAAGRGRSHYVGHRVRRLPDPPAKHRARHVCRCLRQLHAAFRLAFRAGACCRLADARQHPCRAPGDVLRQPADLSVHRCHVAEARPLDSGH